MRPVLRNPGLIDNPSNPSMCAERPIHSVAVMKLVRRLGVASCIRRLHNLGLGAGAPSFRLQGLWPRQLSVCPRAGRRNTVHIARRIFGVVLPVAQSHPCTFQRNPRIARAVRAPVHAHVLANISESVCSRRQLQSCSLGRVPLAEESLNLENDRFPESMISSKISCSRAHACFSCPVWSG